MSSSRQTVNIFSARLRSVREQRQLSQSELASKTGLQPAAISHFETGLRLPSFDNLRRLAIALDASTDYLLGRVDELNDAPVADIAFRDYQELSAADRAHVQDMIALMKARTASQTLISEKGDREYASKKNRGSGGRRP